MRSSSLLQLFFLLHLTGEVISSGAAQRGLWAYECSDDDGNYASNSTYKTILDMVLTEISTTDIPYGFYNFSAGQHPDQVNAIALCRGDINVTECHACLNFLMSNLTGQCPFQVAAFGWAEKCMLRYSNDSIFGLWSESPHYNLATGVAVTADVDHFANVVKDLLATLPNKTAGGDSQLKFATGEARVNASMKVYALMQCTPDLSTTDCLGCLYWAMYFALEPDRGKTGARVLLPSCAVRYDSQKFYVEPPSRASKAAAAIPSFPDRSGKNSSAGESINGAGKTRSRVKAIVRITIPVTLAALLFAVSMYFLLAKKRSDAATDIEISSKDFTTAESLQYDLKLLQAATNNFSDANKLGEGGFGCVYQGKLPNGQEIAVKRLSQRSSQGAPEFKNEVVLVAKLQHRNLVRLLGFCLAGDEKLLVYEFVANKSLDYFLFAERQAELDWTRRYKIIRGIARGLLYLHEDSRLRIIHRDIKPSNILLDADMTPKISDFGLAKILGIDQAQGNTNRIAGTYGYMAPECAFKGEFSESSDVYSFGVMVLEIISGQKINSFRKSEYPDHLMSYAWKKWKDNEALEIMEPNLREGTDSKAEVIRCIHLGLLCVQEDVAARPSMSTVVMTLSCHDVILPQPRNPAFHPCPETEGSRDNKPVHSSVNLVSISAVGPR